MSHHIPETYDAWRRCIQIDCAQALTATFMPSVSPCSKTLPITTPSNFCVVGGLRITSR